MNTTDARPGWDADPAGAFVPGPRAVVGPMGSGRLSGLSFAVKDVFDVAGSVTTFGSLAWERSHPVSAATAPVVTSVLQAGAKLVGKTITVELAFGLTGENPWYGTPTNPRAPDRLPGGSSGGSAAAVAAGLVDFSLGTDTGGSVRIPASYCGLFGIRPTFGAISPAGVCPLAPSLDTVGWFTRGVALLSEVGRVLLPGDKAELGGPLLRLEEAWINAQSAVAEALRPALEKLESLLGRAIGIRLLPEGVDTLYDHMRAVQGEEIWATLGPWVERTRPMLGAGVAARIAGARDTDPSVAGAGRAFRRRLRARLHPLLAGGAVLIAPTSPCPAPLVGENPSVIEAVRQATMGVTGLASLCGLAEVTLPVGVVDGGPVGLSLIAGPGRDQALLGFACDAAEVLGLPL